MHVGGEVLVGANVGWEYVCYFALEGGWDSVQRGVFVVDVEPGVNLCNGYTMWVGIV